MKKKSMIAAVGALAIAAVVVFMVQRDQGAPPISQHDKKIESHIADDFVNVATDDGAIAANLVDIEKYNDAKASDCDHLFESGELARVQSEHYPEYTSDQMCGMALEYIQQIIAQDEAISADWESSQEAKYYPRNIVNSDYRSYDEATLIELAKTDATAAYIAGMRFAQRDEQQAQQYYFQSAKLSGLPGPLLSSFVYRSNIVYTDDPETGQRTYQSTDRLFNAAVYATLVGKLNYDYELAGDLRQHVERAMGDETLLEVDSEAEALYAEIKSGGAL